MGVFDYTFVCYLLCRVWVCIGKAEYVSQSDLYIVDTQIMPNGKWYRASVTSLILELTDCIYGFSNCGLSYEEAKYCLCHVASD